MIRVVFRKDGKVEEIIFGDISGYLCWADCTEWEEIITFEAL